MDQKIYYSLHKNPQLCPINLLTWLNPDHGDDRHSRPPNWEINGYVKKDW